MDIKELNNQSGEFFVIQSEDGRLTHYVPIKDKHTFRILASREKIEEILLVIKNSSYVCDKENKQDRINYFKSQSKIQDLDTIARLLIELDAIDDKGTVEQQIFKKLLNSLAQEYSVITSISENESIDLIVENLNYTKK